VLDGVQDPHIRGRLPAERGGGGVTAVIIPKDKAAPINATVRKTSAGAADRIPVISVTNLARTLRTIKEAGVWVYGLDGEATGTIHAVDFSGNVALVLGGEGEGMRRLTREHCDGLVKIPMPGEGEPQCIGGHLMALFEVVRATAGGRMLTPVVRFRRIRRCCGADCLPGL
jgi:23S rRNA (guanosine2251-2'-O)-methyltransferase